MLCRVLSLLWQFQRCCLLTFQELLYAYIFVLYYTSPWPLIRLPASLTTIEWQRQSTSNPLLLLPLLYPYLRRPVALCQRYTIRTSAHTNIPTRTCVDTTCTFAQAIHQRDSTQLQRASDSIHSLILQYRSHHDDDSGGGGDAYHM